MRRKRFSISAIILAILCIVPPCILLALSFFEVWPFPQILPGRISGNAWKYIARPENRVASALLTSLIIALCVAGVSTMMGFLTSMVVAYHKRKKGLLFLTYLPFVLSPVIFAVCLKFYFIKLGLIGTLYGVILAQLIIAFPYATIVFTGFWTKQMQNYQKLALTLGAAPGYTFRHVLVPMALPMMLVVFFQCFLISWFEYGLTLIIGFGKVETLTLKVFQYLGEANIFYAALSSSLLILPPIILLWVNKKIIYHKTI